MVKNFDCLILGQVLHTDVMFLSLSLKMKEKLRKAIEGFRLDTHNREGKKSWKLFEAYIVCDFWCFMLRSLIITPPPPFKKIMSTFWIDLQCLFCHMKFSFSIFTFNLWCIFVNDARLQASIKIWIYCSALKYWGSKLNIFFKNAFRMLFCFSVKILQHFLSKCINWYTIIAFCVPLIALVDTMK